MLKKVLPNKSTSHSSSFCWVSWSIKQLICLLCANSLQTKTGKRLVNWTINCFMTDCIFTPYNVDSCYTRMFLVMLHLLSDLWVSVDSDFFQFVVYVRICCTEYIVLCFVVGCHMMLLNQIINWHFSLVVQSFVLTK